MVETNQVYYVTGKKAWFSRLGHHKYRTRCYLELPLFSNLGIPEKNEVVRAGDLKIP